MQAIDHAAGYLLAFGINAALCKTVIVRSTILSHYPSGKQALNRKEDLGKSESHLRESVNGFDRLVLLALKLVLEKGNLSLKESYLNIQKSRHSL
jgi:hypothetical protein